MHSVQDIGYDIVAKYATKIHMRRDTLEKAIALLQRFNRNGKISIHRADEYTATYKNTKGKTEKKHCSALAKDKHNSILLLETEDRKTPHDVNTITIVPWKITKMLDAMAITSRFSSPCPAEFARPGSMIFVPTYMNKGRFAGIKLQNGYHDSEQIRELFHLGK